MPTTRTSTPDHLREHGFEPYELGSGVPVRVAILQAAHEAYRSLDPPRCRASSSSSTGATRSSREPFERSRSDVRWHRPLTGPADPAVSVGLAAGRGVWVVLPTYNERENVERIAAAILSPCPRRRC